MENINQKDIPLTKHRMSQLKNMARGSFYRVNAGDADCYAFFVEKTGYKHMDGTVSKGNDWSGGWDWSRSLIDTHAEYIYMLDTGKFYAV